VIRAVIDTNVLVSGLLRPTGDEALIILALQQGSTHVVSAGELLDRITLEI
jgi:predicted nucleic acid-binding protein